MVSMKVLLVCAVTLSVLILAHCDSGTRPKGIGVWAPQFSIQDDERRVALTDFRGQVVVLNFWASYCPPCISETPSLVAMQQRMRKNGVTVLAVSIDEDEQAYHRFIEKYEINFITVREPSQTTEHLYGTVQIPETYIIDRTGILRRKFVNSTDWTSPEVLQFLGSL
jgi:cytochrome c biogenesis protein CcmG, thiol:disulfide interchange protein DsbE